MSKYKISNFKIGEEVIIKHSVLKNIEHTTRGVIAKVTDKKLASGIVVLKIGDSKYMREIPIIYINDVQVVDKNVDSIKGEKVEGSENGK